MCRSMTITNGLFWVARSGAMVTASAAKRCRSTRTSMRVVPAPCVVSSPTPSVQRLSIYRLIVITTIAITITNVTPPILHRVNRMMRWAVTPWLSPARIYYPDAVYQRQVCQLGPYLVLLGYGYRLGYELGFS